MNLDNEIDAINKQYGKGTIMRLGSDPLPIDRLPLGIYSIDKILGGGLPKGRIIEVFGSEASSKSTLCLHAIIAAQKQDLECAFIDVEHSLNAEYAKQMGVNTNNLILSQPSCGEDALNIVDTLANTGSIAIIIVDSVSALVPRAEIEGESGDAHMGLQARLMSQAMRKLTGAISKTNTILIFTNQTRMKIGVVYGDPTTTSGGNALKFYSSVRLRTKALAKIEQNKEMIGNQVRIECVKNKTAPPYKKCELDLIYGIGIDYRRDLFDVAVKNEIIEKRGAWYYDGEKKYHGRDNALELIDFNELLERIK